MRRDNEPKDKEDKDYQVNLAIQESNDKAKKAIHRHKDLPYERKQSNISIIENKREADLLEKRSPTNEELTQKLKGIAKDESSKEDTKYDENDPHESI